MGSVATLIVLTVVTLAPALSLRAKADSANTSEEQVVAEPTDQPLERQAKLRRSWIVYREMGSKDIYALTKDQKKRAIKTLDFFTAFNANYHIKLVKAGRLSEFAVGDPITTVEGLNPADFIKAPGRHRLVKVSGNPAVYLVTPEGKRRVVIAAGVFHRFGWEFRDVEVISETELGSLPEAEAVTDNTVFNEEVEVDTTHQRQERDRLQERLSLRGRTLIRHRLVKALDNPNVYVIDGQGRKHLITSERAANIHRMNLHDITEVTQEELDAFPDSTTIGEAASPVNLDQQVAD